MFGFLILKIGVGGRGPTRAENFLRGAGAGWGKCFSVRDAGKMPKRAPKLLKFQWVFTTSEHVKSLLEGPESGIAKCTKKHRFAEGFGLEDAKKPFSSESQKQRPNGGNLGYFSLFADFFHETLPFLF